MQVPQWVLALQTTANTAHHFPKSQSVLLEQISSRKTRSKYNKNNNLLIIMRIAIKKNILNAVLIFNICTSTNNMGSTGRSGLMCKSGRKSENIAQLQDHSGQGRKLEQCNFSSSHCAWLYACEFETPFWITSLSSRAVETFDFSCLFSHIYLSSSSS